MALEPYKQRDWLYFHYVQKRMNTGPIAELLKDKHNIEVTPQTVYNWLKRFDLLKFRGKGRNLGAKMGKKPGAKRTKRTNPRSARQEAMRKAARRRK